MEETHMKMRNSFILCVAVIPVLMIVQSAFAEGKLEGVWRVSEVWVGDPSAGKITVGPTHPSVIIFTKKHFSFLNIKTATGTRPNLPPKGATDAQKVAAWTPVAAFAGSYEVKDNIMTYHNIVDLDPNGMAPGNSGTSEFKIEGNTLTTIPKTDQNGPIANPLITKFIRVE
jgi:hypothetical protein